MNQLFLMLLLALVGVARAHAQNADVFGKPHMPCLTTDEAWFIITNS